MESAYYVDTGLLSPDATGIQIMSIFGSSTVTSSNRSGRSSAAATAAAAKPSTTAAAAPPFPTFLLPALPLQLFRRRQKSHHQHQSSSSSSSSVVRNDNSSSNNPQNEGDCESDSDSDDGGAPPSLSGSVGSVPSETSSGGGSDATQQHQGRPRRQQPRRRLAPPTPATLRCGICATDLAFASQIVSKGFTGRHGRAFLVAPASPSNVPVPIPAAGRLSWSSSAAAAGGDDGGGELVNIKVGRSENRQLVTGSHVVADISCRVCGTKVGWKYVDARESQQKYKVGKFILETARVVAWRGWDAGRLPAAPAGDDDSDGDYDDGSDSDDDEGLDHREDEGLWSVNEGSTGNSGPKDGADGPDDEEPVVFDSDDDDECEDIFAGTWNAEAVAKRRKMRRALVGRRV